MDVEMDTKGEGDHNPFNPKKKIKDVACLAVFYAFLVSVFILCGIAYSEGNPHILFFGLDYRGRVCGEKSLSGFDARYWVSHQLNSFSSSPNSVHLLTNTRLTHLPTPFCLARCRAGERWPGGDLCHVQSRKLLRLQKRLPEAVPQSEREDDEQLHSTTMGLQLP